MWSCFSDPPHISPKMSRVDIGSMLNAWTGNICQQRLVKKMCRHRSIALRTCEESCNMDVYENISVFKLNVGVFRISNSWIPMRFHDSHSQWVYFTEQGRANAIDVTTRLQAANAGLLLQKCWLHTTFPKKASALDSSLEPTQTVGSIRHVSALLRRILRLTHHHPACFEIYESSSELRKNPGCFCPS